MNLGQKSGDVDIDYSPNDRAKVYDYIISRFGYKKQLIF